MKCPLKIFCKWAFKERLQKTGVSTFSRVCTSDLLDDLQWIAFFTFIFWCLSVPVISHWSTFFNRHDIKGITCVGATATAAAILNWIYQTGSNRLGVVDLFGCEISAICRVSLVIDFAQSCVNLVHLLDHPAPERAASKPKGTSGFTSQENYTPVYDEKLSDLQPLDADVLTSITEFYTYRKTMVDCLRRLAALEPDDAARRQCNVQMIYMQFLMYESGHKAIQRLIEFEPNQTESLINVFCSELVLYRFLLDEYRNEDDCRHQRLKLRENYYRETVEDLIHRVENAAPDQHHWDRAKTTVSELKTRFQRAFSPNMPSQSVPSDRRPAPFVVTSPESSVGK